MRHLISVLILSTFVLLLSSCSGSSSGGSNGANDSGNKDQGAFKPLPAAAPACANKLDLPELFAQQCSGGSNLSLCAFQKAPDCANDVCLFDNRGTFPQAYCSAKCSPTNKSSCPRHFACMKEGCDDSYVCVRVSEGGPLDGFEQGFESIAGRTGNFVVYASATDNKGNRLILTSGSEVLFRSTNGKWRSLSDLNPDLSRMYLRRISVVDDVFYIHHANSYAQFNDRRIAYRFDGKTLSLEEMPSDYPTIIKCNGVSSNGCYGEIAKIWKGSDGSMRALIGDGGRSQGLFIKSGQTWEKKSADPTSLYLAANSQFQMADGKYFAQGNIDGKMTLNLSSDLLSWKTIAPPANAKMTRASVFAFRENDIWVIDDNKTVFRWTGNKWITESNAAKGAIAVFKIGAEKYIVTGDFESTILQSKCWRSGFPALNSVIIPAGEKAGYIDDDRLILFDPNFVPEY